MYLLKKLKLCDELVLSNDPSSPYQSHLIPEREDFGEYVGKMREGMRHGVGECRWKDGSYYRGDWA